MLIILSSARNPVGSLDFFRFWSTGAWITPVSALLSKAGNFRRLLDCLRRHPVYWENPNYSLWTIRNTFSTHNSFEEGVRRWSGQKWSSEREEFRQLLKFEWRCLFFLVLNARRIIIARARVRTLSAKYTADWTGRNYHATDNLLSILDNCTVVLLVWYSYFVDALKIHLLFWFCIFFMQFSTWAVKNKLPFSRFTIYCSCRKVYQKSIERLIFDIWALFILLQVLFLFFAVAIIYEQRLKSLCGQKHASLIEIKRFTRINDKAPINTSIVVKSSNSVLTLFQSK